MIHATSLPSTEKQYIAMKNELKIIKSNMKRLAIASVENNVGRMDFDTLSALTEPSIYKWGLRFTDINYGLEARAAWPVYDAFHRILMVAAEHELESSPERRAAMENFVIGHLDFLAFYKFKNPNWWFNEVGVPLALTYILALAEDYLPRPLYEEALIILEPSSIVKNPEFLLRKTGANLTWFCMLSIRHGALTDNPNEVLLAIRMAEDVTRPGDDGLQEDGSFFQHGKLLYSCGYGRSLIEHFANMLAMLDGTSFAFPKRATDYVLSHLLDGVRYMIYRGSISLHSSGRERARKGALALGPLKYSIANLAACKDLPRLDEIRALSEAIEKNAPTFVGVKYFDVAKHLILNTGSLYFAFQGGGDGVLGAEIINSEGVLDHNYSYGTTHVVMRDGDEYSDINPLMDFSKIPGTTAKCESDEELLMKPDFTRVPIDAKGYGGKCDGERGMCYLISRHEDVSVTVCAFATKRGAVLLGAGISCESGAHLVTTLEQCNSCGSFDIEDGGKVVVHGGIRYTNLDTVSTLEAKILHREESWARNRRDAGTVENAKTARGDVFLLTLLRPDSHSSYAYAITAKEDSADFFEVLSNTADIQAIKTSDGYLLAVFHCDGSLTVGDKTYSAKAGTAIIESL